MLKSVLLCLVLILSLDSYAQRKKKDDLKKYLPTDNIELGADDNRRRNAPKEKRYRQIIKNSTKNVLYGNPCAIEATHKMGFEYVVQSKKAPGSTVGFKRQWNNFKVKTRLFFLRSPFWKIILRGKFRKCRVKSGDKVG